MIRSPSFSLEVSSTTITNLPSAISAIAFSTGTKQEARASSLNFITNVPPNYRHLLSRNANGNLYSLQSLPRFLYTMTSQEVFKEFPRISENVGTIF